MISSLLHLVGQRPRVYYTLPNFRWRGGVEGQSPLSPPQYANAEEWYFLYDKVISNVSCLVWYGNNIFDIMHNYIS